MIQLYNMRVVREVPQPNHCTANSRFVPAFFWYNTCCHVFWKTSHIKFSNRQFWKLSCFYNPFSKLSMTSSKLNLDILGLSMISVAIKLTKKRVINQARYCNGKIWIKKEDEYEMEIKNIDQLPQISNVIEQNPNRSSNHKQNNQKDEENTSTKQSTWID